MSDSAGEIQTTQKGKDTGIETHTHTHTHTQTHVCWVDMRGDGSTANILHLEWIKKVSTSGAACSLYAHTDIHLLTSVQLQ